MTMGQVLFHNLKLEELNANADTALTDADYPASGSYIDVSAFESFTVIIRLGTIADALTFKPQVADAVDGTPADISTDLNHTIAADDDGEWIMWHIETRKLDTDSHFFTVDVSGNSGSNYADMFLLGNQYSSKPVTQTTGLLPTTSQYVYAG